MKYIEYQHIERLGSSDVKNILEGVCYLFYKLDGTNASVWLKEDQTLGFGSRKRELSVIEDNAGFLNSLSSKDYIDEYKDILNYLLKHPTYTIYGEWLVKHTLRTYKNDSWKKFYVFDIFDSEKQKYINYDTYSKEFETEFKHINFIPVIAKLENPSEEDVKSYLDKTGEWLVTNGLGEGLVIKNYDYQNKYGSIKWAKLLTEDFRKEKSLRLEVANSRLDKDGNKTKIEIEYVIADMITDEHILKEKYKIAENYGGWSSKHIFELLNRSYNEFWKDNLELILKKHRNPTINFTMVKKLCDEKVKKLV